MDQNQNFPSSSPITLEEILGSGLSAERFYSIQDVTEFYRGEIAELQEGFSKLRDGHAEFRGRLEKLEKKEQKAEQVIPINFFETTKLKLKKSFNVVLEYHQKENLYIVDCLELNIYGTGSDELSAVEDIKVVLEETYFSLKEDKEKLSVPLQKQWGIFNYIFEEK